jgi:hypothetical protein
MICPNCDHEESHSAKFCSNCGYSLLIPRNLQKQIQESLRLLNENQLKEADDLLYKLYQQYPKNPDVLANVGLLHLKHNKKLRALKFFLKALFKNSKHEIAKKYLRKTFSWKTVIFPISIIAIAVIAASIHTKDRNAATQTVSSNSTFFESDSKQQSDSGTSKNSDNSTTQKQDTSYIGTFNDPDVTIDKNATVKKSNIAYMGFSKRPHLLRTEALNNDTRLLGVTNITVDPARNSPAIFNGFIVNSRIVWGSESIYTLDSKNDIMIKAAYNGSGHGDYTEYIELPADLSIGNTWDYTRYSGKDFEVTHAEIIGLASVKVPAGTYNDCLVVQKTVTHPNDPSKDFDHIETDFYAADIGLIKTDITHKGETFSMNSLLSVEPAVDVVPLR